MELDRARPGRGYLERALAFSERMRARSLLDTLSRSPVELSTREKESDSAEEIYREVQHLSDERLPLVSQNAKREEIEALDNRLSSAMIRLRTEQVSTRMSTSVEAVMRTMPVNQIRMALTDSSSAFLEFSVGEYHNYLWSATDAELRARGFADAPA